MCRTGAAFPRSATCPDGGSLGAFVELRHDCSEPSHPCRISSTVCHVPSGRAVHEIVAPHLSYLRNAERHQILGPPADHEPTARCYRLAVGLVVDVPEVLPYSTGAAAAELARTEEVWRRVAAGDAPPTVRWYGYTAPGVVLGVSQNRSVVDEATCRARGVEVVWRASGGAAVWVDETAVALDVALPAAHPLAGPDVVEAYRWLGALLAAALREIAPAAAPRVVEVDPAAARTDQHASQAAAPQTAGALRRLSCFGTFSPHEVALVCPGGRRKLVGLSQLRKRGVVLFQAGLYTRFSGARLAAVLALPPELQAALAAELDRRAAGLVDLGLRPGDVPCLVEAFSRRAKVRLAPPGE